MNYITHNDLWWIVITSRVDVFADWLHAIAWDEEFTDGPLDAPIGV